VRVGFFTADRIGHFVFDVEYYLTEQVLKPYQHKTIDLFFFEGEPANTKLASMVQGVVTVNPLVRFLYSANQLLPASKVQQLLPARHKTDSRDMEGLLHTAPTQLQFTEDDNDRGYQYLTSVGFEKGDKFVCLVVRDNRYLKQIHAERNWSYHDFRDTNIEDYKQAAVALAKQGYWVFRMGKAVDESFETDHPYVIDYANTTERSDFLDLWLMANCFYAISTGLGLDSVADVFRRPIVFVNYVPLMDLEAWGPYITVPKKLTWTATNRPLSLSEQVKHTSLNGHYYRDNGISVHDMKPDEITDVVLEMEMRLAGTFSTNQNVEKLNQCFWNELRGFPEFQKYHGWIHPNARLGTSYLNESKDWFFSK
jgi:putative glycosyltransferase (TIGR04372 family)